MYNNEINYIIDDFDFIKVYKTMKYLDWRWNTPTVQNKTPTVNEMRKFVRELFSISIQEFLEEKKKSTTVSSGGFQIQLMKAKKKKKIYMSLSFEITSSNNWD